MSEREIWDRRYAEGDYRPRPYPSPFLEQWIPHLPPGRALDVACGAGRNSILLAEAGFEVDAVDVSAIAIRMAEAEANARNVTVDWHVADLDSFDLPAGAYQVITVFRYRNPALWPRLIEALADDGWLMVEHHLKSTTTVAGPTTEDFRLDPQELLHAFGGSLRVLHYSENIEPSDDPSHMFALSRLVGVKGDPGF